MNSKTAAVVVTYNRKDLLEKCIDRLRQQKNAACDIIIVDNASTDGTADMIKCQYNVPEVIYMNTGANLGGAGGFQYGVKQAVLLGYEYVWIMDDDTLPQETALYELFEADRELNGKWGFLSSVAYWTDGSICRMNIQKRIFLNISEKRNTVKSIPLLKCVLLYLYSLKQRSSERLACRSVNILFGRMTMNIQDASH